MGINRSHPVGGPGRGTTAPVGEKEQLEWPRNPPWHLTTSSQECDPPPLTQEEAVTQESIDDSTQYYMAVTSPRWTDSDDEDTHGEPSDSTEYYSAMSSLSYNSIEADSSGEAEFADLEGYLAIERDMLAQMNEENLKEMLWQMTATIFERDIQSARPEEAHNTTDGEPEVVSAMKNTFSALHDRMKHSATEQLQPGLEVTRKAPINNTRLWIWHRKAMQQTALLRRCFYPRRDVIKW
jgi:hypothetical protein